MLKPKASYIVIDSRVWLTRSFNRRFRLNLCGDITFKTNLNADSFVCSRVSNNQLWLITNLNSTVYSIKTIIIEFKWNRSIGD